MVKEDADAVLKEMVKVKLVDLVKKNLSGIRANVQRQGGKYHYDYQKVIKMRTLKRVYYKKEKGVTWIYWEWIPEPAIGEYDCGYSGIADCELHRLEEAYIEVEENGRT